MKYYVYHICRKCDKFDLSKGYVGISNNPNKRWKSGYFGSPHLQAAIKKYDDVVKYIVMEASEEECMSVEKTLRPIKNIAWNIAVGGGKPPSPKGTSNCISNLPLEKRRKKGFKLTDDHRLKLSASQQKVAHVHSKRMSDNNPMQGMIGELHPSFKGWYHTPAGKFGSASSAAKPNGVSRSIIQKRCAKDAIIQRARLAPKENTGKLWSEMGWYFEEVTK